MAGVAEFVQQGGLPPELFDDGGKDSPRKRGVKQGALLMLTSLIVVPLVAILSASIGLDPTVVAITAIVTFWGGLLRILYALIFEAGKSSAANVTFAESFKSNLTGRASQPAALPEADQMPAEVAFRPAPGNWRDTNDLQPSSVTEETTRTLNKDRIPEN